MAKIKFRSDKETIIKNFYKIIFSVIILLCIFAVYFSNNILNIEELSAENNLQQSVLQTSTNIRARIKSDINNLKVLSTQLSLASGSFSENDIWNFLINNIKKENYYKFGFAYPDGRAFQYGENSGKTDFLNWSEEPCFENAVTGNACFSETKEEPETNSGYVNSYFVPVFDKNSQIAGVLGAEIDTGNFKEILNFNNYNGTAFSHVIDSNGNYVIKSQNEKNVFSNFFDAKIKYFGTTKEKVQEDLKTKNLSTFKFRWVDGKKYVAAFSFIGSNNFYVFTSVPKDVLMLHINFLLGGIIVIFLIIISILLIFLRYVQSLYKQNEAAIYKVAFTDELMNSANKAMFMLEAQEILENSKDNKYALILAKIPEFETIKNLFGFQKANRILKDLYLIIKKNLSEDGTFARYEETSFIILQKYNREEDIVSEFINKVTEDIKTYNSENISLVTGYENFKTESELYFTFGIFLVEDKEMPLEEMFEKTVTAQNSIEIPAAGKYQFCNESLKNRLMQEKITEDEIRSALENQQFQIYLQPKTDINTGQLTGAEALVRWIHPERGIIPPMDFIPFAEKNGCIFNLDKCVWKQVFEFLYQRQQNGEKILPISVNISKQHLLNDNFTIELLSLVNEFGVSPSYIELEFTENAFWENAERFKQVTENLNALGFKITIDDFGIGKSPLYLIKNLPLDFLKIDREIIGNILSDEKCRDFAANIIKFAKQSNVRVVAEGVENQEQAEFLKENGCDVAQGFLFSRPLSCDKYIKFQNGI